MPRAVNTVCVFFPMAASAIPGLSIEVSVVQGVRARQATSSPPTEEPGINVVTLAGLANTIQVEILELDAISGSYVHRAVVGQPSFVAQAVSALNVNLVLIPRVRRPAQYVLRFMLRDGSVQEFGYTAEQTSFLRGDQDFWQGQDVEPPAQFGALIQEWLAAAPAQVTVVGWYGRVLSAPDDAQYDDYLSLMPCVIARPMLISGVR
jgi:hypothetical protein